jgi:GR25 family glycosyltransferase involved in LPS biosynthesis
MYQIDDIDIGTAYFPLTTTAYMITKVGAKKLLDQMNKLTYHIDYEMAFQSKTSDLKYLVTQPFVVNASYNDSTIGPNKKSIILHLLDRYNYKHLY